MGIKSPYWWICYVRILPEIICTNGIVVLADRKPSREAILLGISERIVSDEKWARKLDLVMSTDTVQYRLKILAYPIGSHSYFHSAGLNSIRPHIELPSMPDNMHS